MTISFPTRLTLCTATLALLGTSVAAQELNLYTSREPGLVEPLLEAFTKETGVKVNTVFLKDGLAERVASEGEASPADLLMAVDAEAYDLLKITSEAVRQMSEGELLQIEKARRLDITEEVYFDIIQRKTASLIAACCACGAASVSSNPETTANMKRFGELVGLAFQIKDDLFDFEKVKDISYFQMPTIFVQYEEEMEETHWQCDFNGEIISDKLDHHGHSSVILLNRDKLEKLEQHHENTLVLHAEFPQPVHLDVDNSYVNFFQ